MLVPLGRSNFSMFFSIMSLAQTSASLAVSRVWCRDTNHLMSRAMRWLDESGEEEDSDDFSSVLVDSEVLDESPSWRSKRGKSDVQVQIGMDVCTSMYDRERKKTNEIGK